MDDGDTDGEAHSDGSADLPNADVDLSSDEESSNVTHDFVTSRAWPCLHHGLVLVSYK